jgi:serine/threonine protein kinase
MLMEPGQKLGPVRITRLIGRGGMSAVYLGHHETLNIPVAVKAVYEHHQALSERFGLEARALAQLTHPNIVRVLDFVDHHSPPYIVQEYVEGWTLDEYLKQRGTLEPQEAIRIIIEVALALRAAHKIGIIHRDVKPGNIFITQDGGIKLCDFGIATPFDGSVEDILAGTPNFMPPEQLIGTETPDARIDIYALGITFYTLLTGKIPSSYDAVQQFLEKRLKEDLSIPNNVPEYLKPILAAMTKLDREERYQNVDTLINALRLVSDPLLGLDIQGYRLLRRIGHGGQGKVYLASDSSGFAALKILMSDEGIKPEARERFRLEGKVSKYLEHPNIVKVKDYGEAVLTITGENKTLHYIVMEFIKGVDLEALISPQEKPDCDEAVVIVCDVLEALDYAHEKGLIHRDVKARNVLISDQGEVKLADFGLCKYTAEYNPQTSFSFSALTEADAILGSPHFMSPEQIKGKGVDKRTDIYSCGVLLYYLCTYHLPFEGINVTTIMVNILSELVPDPREINKNVSETLAEIIMKMLQKDPNMRFNSCREAIVQLHSYLGGLSTMPPNLSYRFRSEKPPLSGSPTLQAPTIFTVIGEQKEGLTVKVNPIEVTENPAAGDSTIIIEPEG